jgi:5-methylcytosine-specific restriction endonuclease McrA
MPDEARPYSKEAQLSRGTRRYRRKVASPAQWQRIIAAKLGPCRVCVSPAANGGYDVRPKLIEFHHLISRQRGGDDVPDNIVPLCAEHHRLVTEVDRATVRLLAASLTEAERAYVNRKLTR